MSYNRSFAMHRMHGLHQFGPKKFANSLVAEANTEDGFCIMKFLDKFHGKPGILRRFGTGRDNRAGKIQLRQFLNGHFIIPNHPALLAALQDVVVQVIVKES